MAGDAPPISYVTYADFVALEEKATTRHEWLDGVVYDMSGGTIDHARLKARREKFAHYKRIPSLAEYVLVSQKEPRIEVWRRNASDKWELAEEALAGQTATLASLECSLSVDEVYADPLAAEN